MRNLFDEYLKGFLSNFVYREAKKNFGPDGVRELSTVNGFAYTLTQFGEYEDCLNEVMKRDKFSTTFLFSVTPWWAEIKGSNGKTERCALILQNNDKFYPLVIYNWYNYFVTFNIIPLALARKKIPDKNKIEAYAKVLGEKLEKEKRKIFSMGHGEIRTIKGKTHTDRVQTGSETVSTPTGNYTLTSDYFHYSLKQEVTTKTVNTYETVSYTDPDKQALDLCCWFTPETEKEKQRFLKIVENQEKIIQLADEYKRLGIFSGKRKKEIMQTVNNMFEYAYLVVGQACYDRNKTFYEEDMKLTNELIEFVNKHISELDKELNSISITAFEMRKKYKQPRNEWNKFLSEMERVKNILPPKKELLVSTLAELDKRIDNHPAGCGSSNESTQQDVAQTTNKISKP